MRSRPLRGWAGRAAGLACLLIVLPGLPPHASSHRIDLHTGRRYMTGTSSVRTIPVGMYPQALAVDSRTRRAFVRRYDGRILVIDTASLHVVGTTPLPQTFYITHAIAVDERRGRVFVLNRRDDTHPGAAGTVTVLDATSGARLQTITVGIGPVDVAVAERTGRVFVANAGDPPRYGASVSVLDARTGALLRTIPMAAYPALAVDDQRRRVFASSLAGLVVLDAASGARLRTIANTNVSCCDTTPVVDERTGHVIVAPAGGNQVRLVDPAGGRVIRTITVGGALTQDYLGGGPRSPWPWHSGPATSLWRGKGATTPVR